MLFAEAKQKARPAPGTAAYRQGGVEECAYTAERLAIRKNKDFARADAIRKELTDAGIQPEDTLQSATWRRA